MSGLEIVVQGAFTDTSLPLDAYDPGVAGYNYRFDARTLGLADNAAVTSWASTGSSALPLTPAGNAAGTASPTHKANAGEPYVAFDGVDDGLGVAGYTNGSVKAIAILIRQDGTGGAVPVVSGVTAILSRVGGLTLSGNTGGAPSQVVGPNAWKFAFLNIDGNNSLIQVDGSTSAQTPAGVTGSMQLLRLGRENTSYGKFDIASLITWPTALDATQRNTVRTNLKAAFPALALA